MVLKPLIGHVPRESLVVYEGVTDAVAGTTTTLKCSSIGSGSDYPDFDGNQVIPTTGPYAGQARDINGATNGDVAGTITVNKAFDGIIASGTTFIITGIRTTPAEVAALTGYVGYEGATSLADKLTAARAGYLANINNAQLLTIPNLTSITREHLAFPDGFVYFDAGLGSAGTALPIGTAISPASNVANTKTIADNNKLRNIHVKGAFQLGEAWEDYAFYGELHEILANKFDLNGKDVDGSILDNLFVSGAQGGSGDLILKECILYAITNFNGIACCCDLYGSAMSIKDGGTVDLTDCNAIHTTLTITVQAPTRFSLKNGKGNCTLTAQDGGVAFVRGFDGSLIIDAMTLGTLSIYAGSGTDITINGNCSGGTINIYGDCNVTDSSGAGCTVTDYTIYTRTKGLDGIYDAIAAIALVAGTRKGYFKRRIVLGDTGAAQELTADPTTFEDSDAHNQAVINTWEDSALEYTIDGPETETRTVKSVYIDLTWKDQLTGATVTAGKSKWKINRGDAAPGTWDDLTDDHAAAAGEVTVHRSGAIMNETHGLELPFKIKLQVQADKVEANAITVKPGSECVVEVEYEI